MQHAREQLAHTALDLLGDRVQNPVSSTLKLPPIHPCHLVRSSAHIGTFIASRCIFCNPCHASQKLRVPNWHRKSDRHSYRDVREPAFI